MEGALVSFCKTATRCRCLVINFIFHLIPCIFFIIIPYFLAFFRRSFRFTNVMLVKKKKKNTSNDTKQQINYSYFASFLHAHCELYTAHVTFYLYSRFLSAFYENDVKNNKQDFFFLHSQANATNKQCIYEKFEWFTRNIWRAICTLIAREMHPNHQYWE